MVLANMVRLRLNVRQNTPLKDVLDIQAVTTGCVELRKVPFFFPLHVAFEFHSHIRHEKAALKRSKKKKGETLHASGESRV